MKLYEKLAVIDNKIASIEVRLGLPQRRHLLVRQITNNSITKKSTISDTLILPQPYITTVNPKFVNLTLNVEGANSIGVSLNDIQVDIPRIYPKSLFIAESVKTSFYIDPPVNNETFEVIYTNAEKKELKPNYLYQLIYLDDTLPTSWGLILRKVFDRQ